MRLVLDTNVLLSALFSSSSPPAQLFVFWRGHAFDLITSADQIDEIRRVTRYSKIRLRLAPAIAGRLVNQLRELAIVIESLPKVTQSPDPEDNHLLALAQAGLAQFLVTGDRHLLSLESHKSARIVTPATMVELLK